MRKVKEGENFFLDGAYVQLQQGKLVVTTLSGDCGCWECDSGNGKPLILTKYTGDKEAGEWAILDS